MKRLVHVARDAAKQSRRAWLPLIGEPGPLVEVIQPSVVLHEEAVPRLRDLLPADPPEHFGLIVGPEGGLEASELAAIGAPAASLGPQILRTDTAAIVGSALVLQYLGRMG
jgi:16S rRNA (uracil1498-N3)-methyltransferase